MRHPDLAVRVPTNMSGVFGDPGCNNDNNKPGVLSIGWSLGAYRRYDHGAGSQKNMCHSQRSATLGLRWLMALQHQGDRFLPV